jgi:cyanophycin synthetase
VKPEAEAFIKAWEISEPGDLLLFLYEDFQAVKKFIELSGSETRVDR